MREKMLKEFDKDGDGKLSDEEREKAREKMRELRWRPKQATRGKGERGEGRRREEGRGAEARRGPEGRPGPDGPPKMPKPEELFAKFDKDSDQKLSKDEFMALADYVHEHMPPPPMAGPPGPPGGPRFAGRGPDGPPGGPRFEGRGPDGPRFRDGDGPGRRFRGPDGPPRDGERRGDFRRPDGPPPGDGPVRVMTAPAANAASIATAAEVHRPATATTMIARASLPKAISDDDKGDKADKAESAV